MLTLSNALIDIIVAHYAYLGMADNLHKSFIVSYEHQEQSWGALSIPIYY
jgi:hypothetical protein